MRFSKWIALLLALCLLASALPAALAEELEIVNEEAEQQVEEVGETETLIDLADEDVPAEEGTELPPAQDDAESEAPAEDASSLKLSYARVKKNRTAVYCDDVASAHIARLAKGEVVLITGESNGMKAVAMNLSGMIVEGYMKGSGLTVLSEKKVDAYLAKVVSAGAVAIYQNDMNWPLGPLGPGTETNEIVSNAANYTEMDNKTAFTINGKVIRAGDEPTKGAHNCWRWAQVIYKKIWGCGFDSTFEGKASTGHNLVRKLTDNERKLTPENLKHIISHAKPGATLRVQACPSSCSGFNTDGCGKHAKHSLIIAEIRENGLVTMDDQGTVPHTRFYTWQGFCNSWAKWTYVKYVKWPNAPALSSSESVDGYAVTSCSDTYRVRATATKGAGVYSLPSGGTLKAAIAYPATFSASAKALKTIDGYSWVHGKTSTGVTGWLPLNDAVANVKDAISVTGVKLSQSSLLLLRGGTATLNVAIAPLDATNQSVTWTSSDTSVATVSGGVVTGVGGGSATITATTADGAKTATCAVMVAKADYGKELTRTGDNGTVQLPVGKKLQLLPTFALSNGWKIKGVGTSSKKIATVSKTGVVTAKKTGTVTITVRTKNGKKATVKVNVVKASTVVTPETPSTDGPKKIVLSKSGTVSLKVGKTGQLYVRMEPSDASTTLTWKSSNESVAYVDDNGKVYGLKKGTCVIGVKAANGVYDTVNVRVIN